MFSPHSLHRRPLQHPGRPDRAAAQRAAFTLIELLIVLSIIAMLAGLLVISGVSGASEAARVAAVVNDIKNIEKAIADFKLKFNGVDLPSSIVLSETAMGWSGSSPITRRSRSIIQRIWPDFDFSYTATGGSFDINGDGDATDTITLNGSQCLVFFLGGMCLTYSDPSAAMGTEIKSTRDDALATTPGTPQGWIPIGFSTNPTLPFSRAGSARVGPFLEFDVSRLVSTSTGMPGYVDSIPNQRIPFAYASAVSSARGAGYQAADLDTGTASSLTTWYTHPSGEPINPRSYQLISPGFDFLFGTGGTYDGTGITTSARADERDNIASFSKGQFGG